MPSRSTSICSATVGGAAGPVVSVPGAAVLAGSASPVVVLPEEVGSPIFLVSVGSPVIPMQPPSNAAAKSMVSTVQRIRKKVFFIVDLLLVIVQPRLLFYFPDR